MTIQSVEPGIMLSDSPASAYRAVELDRQGNRPVSPDPARGTRSRHAGVAYYTAFVGKSPTAMLHWTTIANFLGGIGLFLLGMRLMTDGLKVAAGGALRELLKAATGSRLRALVFGAGITALLQSSSAVIFATIGFVNAGLLGLGPAVNLIIGANLGTTLTSWIVALVGFKLDLKLFAMPMIALGTALWLSGSSRREALGGAVIGFGVFFLGLDVLKEAFSGLDRALDLAAIAGDGVLALLMFTGIGALLTLLMQSSSAALAVTLTAAAQGVIPLEAAAGVVVGANIGTTSTAVFATLGATAAARRTAAAHVIFNVVAGAIALLLLPWLIALSRLIADATGASDLPATQLAILHTQVNLLGVMVIWPLLPRLVTWLERRFLAAEKADAALPRHLDDTVLDLSRSPRTRLSDSALETVIALEASVDRALTALADLTSQTGVSPAEVVAEFDNLYKQTKADLLRRGSRGELRSATLVQALDRLSSIRRIVNQTRKATVLMLGRPV